MLRDYNADAEAIGGAGAGTGAASSAPTHKMPKWSRKPRNPKSAETRRLIGLAIEARDEAAARPTVKSKALREAAYMRVIVACEPMIQAYVSRFASRELEREDLVATATLGLIEALNRFDDSKSGGGWTGYVGSWMHWKLQQHTGSTRTHKIETVPLYDGWGDHAEHGSETHVALLNGTSTDASQWGHKAKFRAKGAE